jgi:3-oxoacyl-[acyl-carrier protein] reductase
MSNTLKNKRALVTGGTRGIGAGIVRRLASEGADVAFTYSSSPDQANQMVQEIQQLGVQTVAIQANSAAAKYMKAGGRIINIGSTNAERMPFAGGGVYAMSKSALQGLVQGLSRDLGPRGITINNVQPGPVATDLNPSTGAFAETMKGFMALPRYGTVEEIASFVAYLAGPEASYITGANLMIDGGFSA